MSADDKPQWWLDDNPQWWIDLQDEWRQNVKWNRVENDRRRLRGVIGFDADGHHVQWRGSDYDHSPWHREFADGVYEYLQQLAERRQRRDG